MHLNCFGKRSTFFSLISSCSPSRCKNRELRFFKLLVPFDFRAISTLETLQISSNKCFRMSYFFKKERKFLALSGHFRCSDSGNKWSTDSFGFRAGVTNVYSFEKGPQALKRWESRTAGLLLFHQVIFKLII